MYISKDLENFLHSRPAPGAVLRLYLLYALWLLGFVDESLQITLRGTRREKRSNTSFDRLLDPWVCRARGAGFAPARQGRRSAAAKHGTMAMWAGKRSTGRHLGAHLLADLVTDLLGLRVRGSSMASASAQPSVAACWCGGGRKRGRGREDIFHACGDGQVVWATGEGLKYREKI